MNLQTVWVYGANMAGKDLYGKDVDPMPAGRYGAMEPNVARANHENGIQDLSLVDPIGYLWPDGQDYTPNPAPPIDTAEEVAGEHGIWLPDFHDNAIPANLAGMAGITASPLTAWEEGSHMKLGDDSLCHWNSSAWTVDAAPAVFAIKAEKPKPKRKPRAKKEKVEEKAETEE